MAEKTEKTEEHAHTRKTAAEQRADLVEQWFFETFRESVIAQNTQHYNFVRKAVDDLKTRLG